MLFQQEFWSGIHDGSITLTFRRWKRPQVLVGRTYRSTAGRLEVSSVEVVDPARITNDDALRAGHQSAEALRSDMPGFEDDPVYRIEFRYLEEPDPVTSWLARTPLPPKKWLKSLVGWNAWIERRSMARGPERPCG